MNKLNLFHRLVPALIILLFQDLSGFREVFSQSNTKYDIQKSITIEDFDDGSIQLESYPGEDINPSAWELNSSITYEGSPYSLRLYGNTWKLQDIQTVSVDSGDVWQVSAYIDNEAEIQGFGLTDGVNVLFYSFAGSEELNEEEWIPVYQGCFPENQWNDYQLPIADDWLALYDYLPEISSIVYINDNDGASSGVVYFDQIENISQDLPGIPEVSIDYSIGSVYKGGSGKYFFDVQFYSEVVDPDSDEHDFFWNFGDGSTSTEEDPMHTFLAADDHPYTVLLQAVDPTGRWGQASCNIEVEAGSSSYPVTMNFVGDIMLARNFETAGGIIQTQGVNSIFEPTKPFLGDAADITVANLECPFTTHWENHPTKTIYFKSSPANISGISYAGIDIVTLANNHILDYMLPGMQETQSVLESYNILHSGAGANSYEAYLPVFYSKSGVNFAFLSASDRTGQYNNYQPYLNAGYNKPGFGNLNEYYIKKQINEVTGVSDLVVMEWHCGYEYSTEPHKDLDYIQSFEQDNKEEEEYSPYLLAPKQQNREIRQYAVDQGADLVICHHPHIIHGVELYKGKLIAHSLGNFVFDLAYSETFPTMILNTKVDETGFYEFTIIPAYIDDYIPQRAEGGLGLYILDDLAKLSKNLDTYLKVDRENVTALVIMDTLNMLTNEKEYIAQLDFKQISGNWLSDPFQLEREGSISSVDQIKPQADYEFRLGREKIWFGNMEDEGCTLWDMNNINEIYCDTTAYSGERSIQHKRVVSSPYNLVTNLEKKIICRSDTSDYSLAGYIKTLNGKNVTVEVQYFDNRYSSFPIGEENIGSQISGDSPWIYYHKELNIPSGTKFFDIRLNSDIPDAGTAFSWFDNVGIICWDNWGKYDIEQKIPAPNDYYFIQVRSSQDPGEITIDYTETVFDENPSGTDDPIIKPNSLSQTEQNFPNPFNPAFGPTNITFNLENPTNVSITVYDLHGKIIKVLTQEEYKPGTHKVFWDGTNTTGRLVRSGLYYYQYETPHYKEIKKCILLNY